MVIFIHHSTAVARLEKKQEKTTTTTKQTQATATLACTHWRFKI